MIHLPKRKVIMVNIKTNLNMNFMTALFEKVKKFIVKEEFEVVDNIFGLQIAKIKNTESGDGERLFQICIPIN